MGLQHIPESTVEKGFIMLYTLCTSALAENVYREFESLMDLVLNRPAQKMKFENKSID